MRKPARYFTSFLAAVLLLVLSMPAPTAAAEPTGTLQVLAQTVDGIPIAAVSVLAAHLNNRYSVWQPNVGGALRPLQLPPGQYSVAVSASGYEAPPPQTVAVAANQTQTVTFTLAVPAQPGQLSGRIIEVDTGAGASGAVAVKLTRQSDGVPFVVTPGKDGSYAVPVLQPGTYTATTFALTWDAQEAYITDDRVVKVTIEPGQATQTNLYVIRKGRVTARVQLEDGSAAAGAQLVLTDGNGGTRTVTADPSGSCTTALAPGIYDVRATGPAYGPSPVQRVTVAPGKTLTLTLQVRSYGWLQIRVVDPQGRAVPNPSVRTSRVGSGLWLPNAPDGAGVIRPYLGVGTYRVVVSAPGYRKAAVQLAKVEGGKSTLLVVTLEPITEK